MVYNHLYNYNVTSTIHSITHFSVIHAIIDILPACIVPIVARRISYGDRLRDMLELPYSGVGDTTGVHCNFELRTRRRSIIQ